MPDVLLLGEPTNHLDLAKIALLENWLDALPREMPVIIASPDRAFRKAGTNRTLFLQLLNFSGILATFSFRAVPSNYSHGVDGKLLLTV